MSFNKRLTPTATSSHFALMATMQYFARSFTRSFATKAAKASKTPPGRQSTPLDNLEKEMIEVLRPLPKPPARSEEERKHLRGLMIRYGKLKWRHHVELQKRLREFLRAKWAAVDALPHKRRLEALHTEPTPIPLNRPIFTETPPIKGFNPGDLARDS